MRIQAFSLPFQTGQKFMKERIAQTLRVDIDKVNIKATTTEGLGFVGREEGIGALAVASVVSMQG